MQLLLVEGSGISLPNLQTLTLHEVRMGVLDDLKHLRLPSLLKLSISFGTDYLAGGECSCEGANYVQEQAGDLAAILLGGNLNGKPTLRSLAISNCKFRAAKNLCSTLHAVSSLTDLTLDFVTFEDDLFSKLLSGPYLPHLNVMKLLNLEIDLQDLHHLDEIVLARGIDLTTSQSSS